MTPTLESQIFGTQSPRCLSSTPLYYIRPVGSGAAWRQSTHQKSAGGERRREGAKKEEKGGKKEKRGEKGKLGRGG